MKGKLEPAEELVRKNVRVPLTQTQFDVLCSLTYNSGNAIDGSQLLRLLNDGDYLGASDHFIDFNHSEHQIVRGLTWRREKERSDFAIADCLTPATRLTTGVEKAKIA